MAVKREAPKTVPPKKAVWCACAVLLALWHGSHECKVVMALNIFNIAPTIFWVPNLFNLWIQNYVDSIRTITITPSIRSLHGESQDN